MGFQVGEQLGLVELVVDAAALRLLEHRRRQVAARQAPRPRRDQRPAQAGAAAEVGDVELARRRRQRRRQRVGDERRRAVAEGRRAWRRSSPRSRRRTARRRRRWRARARLRRGRRRGGGARRRCRAPRPASRGTSRPRRSMCPALTSARVYEPRRRLPGGMQRASPGARRRLASAIRSCAISSSVRWCQASPNVGAISIARRHAASPSAQRLRRRSRLPRFDSACGLSASSMLRRKARSASSVWRRCFSTLPRLFQMPATSGSTATAWRSSAERGGVLAALVLEHAHVVEDVGVIGPALEQGRVDHLRVVELIVLVTLDRQRQRLFRRETRACAPPPRVSSPASRSVSAMEESSSGARRATNPFRRRRPRAGRARPETSPGSPGG